MNNFRLKYSKILNGVLNMKITSLLLAGGLNKRMNGIPKWELQIGNEPLLERSIRSLKKFSDEILIITGGVHKIVLTEQLSGVKVIYDDKPHLGPLNGILTGLKRSTTQYNFVVAADMPFFSIDLASYMYKQALTRNASMAVPIWQDSMQPLHGIYSKDNIASIERELKQENYSLIKWISQQENVFFLEEKEIKQFTNEDKIFFNMNSPDDYGQAINWVNVKEKPRPIISFVGYSGSGKTTLLAKVIKAFKEDGFRVATIKHDAHKFEIDHEGKDTWEFAQAGSDIVVINSTEKLALIEKSERPLSFEEVLNKINNVDIIFVEGYKQEFPPKILIIRYEEDLHLLNQLENVIAIATTLSLEVKGIPVYDLNDCLGIVRMIQSDILGEKTYGTGE